MELKQLIIKGLYGYYDYDVKFNSDMTFLYGKNGCGKTTILNIVESIITGEIYKLSDYNFISIELFFGDEASEEKIYIEYQNEKILLIFKKNEHILNLKNSESENINLEISDQDREREIPNIYFKRYPILVDISKTFNYIYLPLNRINHKYRLDRIRLARRILYRRRSVNNDENLLENISCIIRENYRNIEYEISKVNDKFRDNILKSFLISKNYYNINKIINTIIKDKRFVSELDNIQKTYLGILTELDIVNDNDLQESKKAFSKIIDDMRSFYIENKKRDGLIDLVLRYQEIMKIKDIIELAKLMEKEKCRLREPLELFLNTMNDFIKDESDSKEIYMDNFGKVYFKMDNTKDKIEITNLSSGEKQLLIFFTYLIFEVDRDSKAIFVVDEPELSLHLSWQKQFVKKIRDINPNIQLIFATHAPEIVGGNYDKMVELKKIFNKYE